MDILLYDREAEARNFWKKTAEARGFSLETESTWSRPERLPQCPIIIADQSAVDGQFSAEVAAAAVLRPHQVIVATGAHFGVTDVIQMMSNGVEFVIEKPFPQEGFMSKFAKVLDSSQERQRCKREFEDLHSLFDELTNKEQDVLDFVLKGIPNKRTAEELKVSVRTIEARRAKVYLKTNSDCVAELVRKVDRLQSLKEVFEPHRGVQDGNLEVVPPKMAGRRDQRGVHTGPDNARYSSSVGPAETLSLSTAANAATGIGISRHHSRGSSQVFS
ncbi:MAG: LuxR C-terminal-related transcriptional regulator [Planctomycetota bacterium]